MEQNYFNTPILFIIFNRPDTTKIVFNEIRKIKPKVLYVSADGPRKSRMGEEEKCKLAREVIESVNWECNVRKLYNEENLGCKNAVSNAITWFFENEEQGIILEDDVVPNKSFFNFTSTLLSHYKNNSKVMHISGNNFLGNKTKINSSYYFSIYPHIWGWATWRRAWKLFDRDLKDFPAYKSNNLIERTINNSKERKYWLEKFEKVFNNQIDTWDYQWLYAIWKNEGVCVTPKYNLAMNIGFREDATHTKIKNSYLAEVPTIELTEISHPAKITVAKELDKITFNEIHYLSVFKKLRMLLGIK